MRYDLQLPKEYIITGVVWTYGLYSSGWWQALVAGLCEIVGERFGSIKYLEILK